MDHMEPNWSSSLSPSKITYARYFYNFIDKYVDRSGFELLEMDTVSFILHSQKITLKSLFNLKLYNFLIRKGAEVPVKTIQEFKDEAGSIRGSEAENEFSSAPIRKFCEDNDIRSDTKIM